MLDTNICIYILKKQPQKLLEKFKQHHFGEIGISSIVLSELQYGVEKSQRKQHNQEKILALTSALKVLPYDEDAAYHYGTIRAELEKKVKIIGPLDLLIAAHACSLNLTLITNNLREFKRIPQLSVENWG